MPVLTVEATEPSMSYIHYFGAALEAYLAVHNAANANQFGSGGAPGAQELGQIFIPPNVYRVFRLGAQFDCSALPATFVISDARIELYCHSDNSTQDFDVTIVNGDDLDFPPVAADYGELLDEIISYGTWNTSLWPGIPSYINIELNALGIAEITAGIVQFGLRSSRDIGSDVPITLEYGFFGLSTAIPIRLVITYTTFPLVQTLPATEIT